MRFAKNLNKNPEKFLSVGSITILRILEVLFKFPVTSIRSSQ